MNDYNDKKHQYWPIISQSVLLYWNLFEIWSSWTAGESLWSAKWITIFTNSKLPLGLCCSAKALIGWGCWSILQTYQYTDFKLINIMSNIWIHWLFSNQHFLFCCAFETGLAGYDKTGSGHKQSGEMFVYVLPLHCDILRYTKASWVKRSTDSTQQRKSRKSYKALERWRKDEINQHALPPPTLREDVKPALPTFTSRSRCKRVAS